MSRISHCLYETSTSRVEAPRAYERTRIYLDNSTDTPDLGEINSALLTAEFGINYAPGGIVIRRYSTVWEWVSSCNPWRCLDVSRSRCAWGPGILTRQ